MKDKRQKMTLTWPCGDPILAAYVAEQTDISSVFILASIFMFLGVIVLQKVSSEKKVKNKNLKEE